MGSHTLAILSLSFILLIQRVPPYLLLILNGWGLFTSTVPNFLADRFVGSINLLILLTILSGVLHLYWISIITEPKLYTSTIFYGKFSAAVQALFPASLASLTSDMKKTGVRMGMVLSIVSFAALTGSPIAGALASRGNGSYLFARVFAGVSMFVGTGTVVIAWEFKAGFSFMVKV